MEEIRKGFLARKLDSIADRIEIIDPDEDSRNSVRKAAWETGDIAVLSETDVDVIAVALMIQGTVVTDDYSVQNTCRHLGIEFQGSTIPGIKKEIKWIWRCTGCRKKYREKLNQCPVCGHELRRFPASQRD